MLKLVMVLAALLSFFLSGLLFDLEQRIEAGPSSPRDTAIHAIEFGPKVYYVDEATLDAYRSARNAETWGFFVALIAALAALALQARADSETE